MRICRVAFLAFAFGLYQGNAVGTPVLEWSRSFGTVSHHDFANDIAVDPQGNAYVGGSTYGSLGGPNTGNEDAYVGKFDSSGTQLWLRQFGSTGSRPIDQGRHVATDGLGGVYIVGGTYGNLEGTNAGSPDGFLRKYDESGDAQWTRQFGTFATEFANAVAADDLGNVYVAGQTDDTLGGPSLGSRDGFVRKYDTNGSLTWSRQVGSHLFDVINGITTDSDGNVFTAGFSIGGGGPLPSTSMADATVGKLDSAGNVQWIKSFGTNARDSADGVAADSFGNVYVAGTLSKELADPDSSNSDAFLAKYDATGNQLWLRRWDTSLRENGLAVATDSAGHAYLAGRILNPTEGSIESADAFVVKFDSDGEIVWEFTHDVLVYEEIWGVAVDGSGNVYAAGTQTQTIVGDYDALLLKLSQIPEPATGSVAFAILVVVVVVRRRSGGERGRERGTGVVRPQ